MKIVCRVCFNACANEECLQLSAPSGFDSLTVIEKVLKNVIPEMNIDLIKDSSVCTNCWESISQFYKLKLACLQNEETFFEFLTKNDWQGTINDFVFPIEFEIVEHGVKEAAEIAVEEKSVAESTIEDSNFLLNYQEDPLNCENWDEEIVSMKGQNEGQNVVENTNEELEEHKTLSCSLCATECKNFTEAVAHATASHGVHVVLPCALCSVFFTHSKTLETHLLNTHDKKVPCKICGAKFINTQSLNGHLRMHPEREQLKKQPEFKCPQCSLVFVKKRQYNSHVRTHQRNLYTCEFCGRSHATKRLLEEHILIHDSVKRYMCEKCGMCFKQKSLLWFHNHKYHLKIKTKQCPYCPKKFFRNHELKMHLLMHTKEKTYQCHVCQKTFTRPSNRNRHMAIHVGKQYQCDICGKSYKYNYDLKKHSCDAGNSQSKKGGCRSKILQSKEVGTVNCKICDKVFNRYYIKLHMRTHTGEKPELCSVCGKAFSTTKGLWQHKISHTDEKRYKCKQCDCSYRQKKNYDLHVRRKHSGEKS